MRLANEAITERGPVAELATGVTSYVSNLYVFVPLAPHMSELAELVLLCSLQFDICKQHALVTFSKVEVSHSKVGLEDVLHTHSSDWRRSDTEGVHRVYDTEV